MAKVHKTYRLDADLVAQVEAWAQAHGTNQGEAMAQLLSRGLDRCSTANERRGNGEGNQDEPKSDAPRSPSEARESSARSESEVREQSDLVAVLRGNVADLRGQVTTLTAQLAAKDEQISGLMALAGRAQALQAAEAARSLDAGKDTDLEAEAVTTDEAEPQEAAGGAETVALDLEDIGGEDGPQNAPQRPTGGLRSWLRDLFGI